MHYAYRFYGQPPEPALMVRPGPKLVGIVLLLVLMRVDIIGPPVPP